MTPHDADILNLLAADGAKLHAMLYRLTLRADAADDLLQELFLRLRESIGFQAARDPRAYAFRSAIHLASRWRRMRARQATLSDASVDEPFAESNPAGELIRREAHAAVLDALTRVGPTARAAFVLRHIEERSFADVGASLGKSEHQVRALCHKAVRRIREILRVKEMSNE